MNYTCAILDKDRDTVFSFCPFCVNHRHFNLHKYIKLYYIIQLFNCSNARAKIFLANAVVSKTTQAIQPLCI